jgi:hypothetical protein
MEYSDDDLIEEIRSVAERIDSDGAPSFRTFKEHGDIPASAVTDRFGSWNAAAEHAGFEPNTATDKIPRSDLVAELRRLRDDLGEIPTGDQMDEHGEYAYITYYERFGSWANALEEVFGEVPSRSWEHVSDEELLAELRRLADDEDTPPTTTAYRERGSHSIKTYDYRFGSWREALSQAGFEPPPPQAVTTEELLADLRRLRDEFGKRPTTTMVNKHGKHSTATYYSRFDSWGEALDHAFDGAAAGESGDDD